MDQAVRTRLAFLGCVVVWGSTWAAIKIGYEGIDPLMGASLRFGIAALVLLIMGLVLRKPLLPREREHWKLAGYVGVAMFGVNYGLIYWGEQYISSGLTAVLFATMPLLVAMCAHVYVPGERLNVRKMAGILLGVVGTAVIFRRSLTFDPSLLLPMGAIVLSALSASTGTVAIKRHGRDLPGITLNFPGMVVGTLVLLTGALLMGERIAPPTTSASWGAVIYLAVAGSVVTFLLLNHVIRHAEATTSALIPPLTPIVALALGALLLNEPITLEGILGAVLIVGGVLVTVMAPRRPRAPARPPTGGVPARPPRL